MKLKTIIEQYERFCPQAAAMIDDPVGLQVGDINADVHKVMVALNLRSQTVSEAILRGVDLIIVKHPLIFSKLSTLLDSNTQEKIILDCIRNGINVYVSHTNIDIIPDGLNDYFCEKLEMSEISVLHETQDTLGIGRVGQITPVTFSEFTEQVKLVFDLKHLIIVADNPDKYINRVAICGGSGGKFYSDALRANADVYITGDIYYHTAHDMLAAGLLAIDPGHHIEVAFIALVAKRLEAWKKEFGWSCEIIQSEANTNPFQII
ncbi:MAG: Nif3-like dinuclear metal center hexameric protein [Streptococcaceae bacterium]|jgi:dinuclear metal center YbgI/SA1388 family protein|nr:Nif3-like dinuclear metal center hexameric protein [Streptococcaceae bacterium]